MALFMLGLCLVLGACTTGDSESEGSDTAEHSESGGSGKTAAADGEEIAL